MTALAPQRSVARHRLLSIVRLHLANPATLLATPLAILGAIFVGSLIIWLLVLRMVGVPVAGGDSGVQITGGTTFIFIYMLVVAVQATNVTFALALGYGSTRRDYSLGTALTFVGLSAAWTVLYSTMSALEQATNGWGLGGYMFRAAAYSDVSWLAQTFATFSLFLFFFFAGSAVAAVFVRWRATGMTVFFLALGALIVGLVALFTLTDSWDSVWLAFEAIGFTGAFALLLVPTVLSAVLGALILRRATPRG
ncbi:ABC transporter permease [Rathayibacter festucae]|uniref:ABC transporter permease n=1 Tax=Rathayibacter festucae TaxID=110937 RepID=UPI001FB4E83D|nr:ABC transporter permease [Rathayibacter festucae]MCJ1699325.1 ABC transporter permease [Rathayibacter festucae]